MLKITYGATLTILLSSLATQAQGSATALHYASQGHTILFRPDGYSLSNGAFALRVEFEDSRVAVPSTEHDARNLDDTEAAHITLGDRVTYDDVWPGIDVTYDAPEGGILRSTWTLDAGADPGSIRMRYSRPITVTQGGDLTVKFDTGMLSESRPVAWQELAGRRMPVEVSFILLPGDLVGFRVAAYRPDLPLTIDPTWATTWRTFLGGSRADHPWYFVEDPNGALHAGGPFIAVEAGGNAYVVGSSDTSNTEGEWHCAAGVTDCPLPSDSPWCGSNAVPDAFVAKLDGAGGVEWYTFLASAGADHALGVAVDCTGNVYVVGKSYGSWQCSGGSVSGVGSGGFIVKLDPTLGSTSKIPSGWPIWMGSELNAVAVDCDGNAYVAGLENGNAFVTKLVNGVVDPDFDKKFLEGDDCDGSETWDIGGQGNIAGIALSGGSVYAAGNTRTSQFGAVNSQRLPFVAKWTTSGAKQWWTRFGGNGEKVSALAADESGNAYVAGRNGGAYAYRVGPSCDVIGGLIDGAGATVVATGIAVDDSGLNGYLVGYSNGSWGTPQIGFEFSGGEEAWLARLPSGNAAWDAFDGNLPWSMFLGSTHGEWGTGVALTGPESVYVVGYGAGSWNNDVWATPPPVIEYTAGSDDVFVLRGNPLQPVPPETGCAADACLATRQAAWRDYIDCVTGDMVHYYSDPNAPSSGYFKGCLTTYFLKWDPCMGSSRFMDNGNETVTDNLSGLVWEKKTQASDVHDADLIFLWSKLNGPWLENGPAFTEFLESLNGDGFAGSNGWRLPTLAELLTLMDDSGTGMVPEFSDPKDNAPGPYWSATSNVLLCQACNPPSACAWYVTFDPLERTIPPTGGVEHGAKDVARHVRAVRGGL